MDSAATWAPPYDDAPAASAFEVFPIDLNRRKVYIYRSLI